ncbi:MAG: hypothetical protein OEQ29_24120 [Alphaproteobacteria bacterium]|nr:hypothetical protein [Alphaproteobacteria bacterium]
MLRDIHVYVDHQPIDEFDRSFQGIGTRLKSLIWNSPYSEVFDFLTHVMRHTDCPYQLEQHVAWCFRKAKAAYWVDTGTGTIFPAATEEEGNAIRAAFAALRLGIIALPARRPTWPT